MYRMGWDVYAESHDPERLHRALSEYGLQISLKSCRINAWASILQDLLGWTDDDANIVWWTASHIDCETVKRWSIIANHAYANGNYGMYDQNNIRKVCQYIELCANNDATLFFSC